MATSTQRRGSDERPRPRSQGRAGTRISLGEIERLDENRRTRGRKWRGWPSRLGVAQQMLTNTYVRSSRDGVADLVTRAAWDFEAGGDRPIDHEAAAFQRWIWFERLPWQRYVGRIVRGYLSNGFHLEELTDDVRPLPPDRFKGHAMGVHAVVPTGLHERPAWSVERWEQSSRDSTQVARVVQHVDGSDVETPGEAPIDGDRVLRFTWQQEGADFEGHAPQRQQFGPSYVMRLLARIELLTHNKQHMGVPVATRGEGANDDDDKKLADNLSRWQADERGHIILPFGYSLDLVSASPGTAIRNTIDACKYDILQAYGFGFLLHGQQNTAGSYRLADVQNGHAMARLDVHGDFVDEVFNFGADGWSPIERYHRLNYGDRAARPFLVVRHMPTVDFAKALPVIWDGIKVGAIKPDGDLDEFARLVMRAPPPNASRRYETTTGAASASAELDDVQDDADGQEAQP